MGTLSSKLVWSRTVPAGTAAAPAEDAAGQVNTAGTTGPQQCAIDVETGSLPTDSVPAATVLSGAMQPPLSHCPPAVTAPALAPGLMLLLHERGLPEGMAAATFLQAAAAASESKDMERPGWCRSLCDGPIDSSMLTSHLEQRLAAMRASPTVDATQLHYLVVRGEDLWLPRLFAWLQRRKTDLPHLHLLVLVESAELWSTCGIPHAAMYDAVYGVEQCLSAAPPSPRRASGRRRCAGPEEAVTATATAATAGTAAAMAMRLQQLVVDAQETAQDFGTSHLAKVRRDAALYPWSGRVPCTAFQTR